MGTLIDVMRIAEDNLDIIADEIEDELNLRDEMEMTRQRVAARLERQRNHEEVNNNERDWEFYL